MDSINFVEEKLKKFGLMPYDRLDEKTRKRLLYIGNFILISTNKVKKSKEEIKYLRLTKSSLTNSKDISFSRKTLYNDPIIKFYVEKYIYSEENFFNENKTTY